MEERKCSIVPGRKSLKIAFDKRPTFRIRDRNEGENGIGDPTRESVLNRLGSNRIR